MEKRNLKLIKIRRPVNSGRTLIWSVALLLAVAMLVATLNGADRARTTVDPRELAESALQQALSQGGDDEQVLEKLHQLRRMIGGRPLDSRTRVVYASLLLSLGGGPEDLAVTAFHARVAAALSPVTVPIVRVAALVLASSGETDEALSLIREMFEYDPKAAGGLLAAAEPLLREEQVPLALPERPEAWLAWSRELYLQGRRQESEDWLERGHLRWPENLPLLKGYAAGLIRGARMEELATLFPEGGALPDQPEAAPLYAYRAHYKGMKGDVGSAREDLARALELGDGGHRLLLDAGGAYESIGDFDEARRQWHAALFSLPSEKTLERMQLILRLARLEERQGEPAAALRLWRRLLEIDPDHEEARRRIAALTGA
jgi:tetratricopeptide (TPR) repeat protein